MRLSIKLFETRYILKMFFPTERHIKWLPAIMWGKVKCDGAGWVGLTDKELQDFSETKLGSYDLCLEVEAKLKEKNT